MSKRADGEADWRLEAGERNREVTGEKERIFFMQNANSRLREGLQMCGQTEGGEGSPRVADIEF